MNTCSGRSNVVGRRAKDLVIEAFNGSTKIPLPVLLECNEIPDNRTEIPSPQVAVHHKHLRPLADQIPDVDPEVDIMLLLGRDVPQVHKIRESRNGPNNAPWAQRLDLGWVILGEVCKGKVHQRSQVNAFRTQILENGRPSLHTPCDSHITVSENYTAPRNFVKTYAGKFVQGQYTDNIGEDVYKRTAEDNQIALSIEDKEFIDLMSREMVKDPSGSLIAPLPFQSERKRLPNNAEKVRNRFRSLCRNLEKKPAMKQHYITFMDGILNKHHAELAPEEDPAAENWYLPHFGVYHPKKPGKIRVVFDSSDQFRGHSLNKSLLTGPDLLNSLLGVLIRFRSDVVAIIADIEQMFHSFLVKEDHRNFLRFFWFHNNDPAQEVVTYRMRVHVFGNSPSPAVATFGLRKTAKDGEEQFGRDARVFVERDFYCDDGLKSVPTPEEAIDLLHRTKAMLFKINLRLHKIASNSKEVMDAFPDSERASDLCNLDFDNDEIPLQRSLGIHWQVRTDCFTFKVSVDDKPFTRRGVLSVINSLYDPLGFVQPVVIGGKILLREMTKAPQIDWDDDLPEHLSPSWNSWRQSLCALEKINIPRAYIPRQSTEVKRRELHVFADASQQAIAAVAYLRVVDKKDNIHIGFVMGKAKLAPKHAVTIPRLELNSAVLAVELSETVSNELDLEIMDRRFYSDSKVVLGYLNNRTKRFYVYVANRVERVLRSTSPAQWSYIRTELNPADHATRAVPAYNLEHTNWLRGPDILRVPDLSRMFGLEETFHVAEDDKEVRQEVHVFATQLSEFSFLETKKFYRFSQWDTLIRAVARLVQTVRCKISSDCHSPRFWHMCAIHPTDIEKAKKVIILSAQRGLFQGEIQALMDKKCIPKISPLYKLDPYVDEQGLLRIGGRLRFSQLDIEERHPIILCRTQHISILIARHAHEAVQHQGRSLTLGSLRSKGYWIIGSKRLIATMIEKCITCRRQRGRQLRQKMADLPQERLIPDAPFTHVGVDIFGHWLISHRHTRGSQAQAKRWAALFTCFTTRAIHIEVVESLDTSAFLNAVRRFMAVRGPVKKFFSDCGTNFEAGSKELEMVQVSEHLLREGCEWSFNPPHASHMGGVWERMIGIVRRILDSMFLKLGPAQLSHDVLHTFLAEVSAIVNSRPLVPVSDDPECPEVLTPAMLLNQKTKILSAPPGTFTREDLFGKQWRRAQYLADVFWTRWKREYLPTLQPRRKWQKNEEEIEVGDIVLLKDNSCHRNDWPTGRVISTTPSHDERIRRVEVKVPRGNTSKIYTRPINELVLLMSNNDK